MRSLALQESTGDVRHLSTETAHTMLRFVFWLLRGDGGAEGAIPIRVFYKFDSGGWRSRSTRQLQKVYRCR